MPNSTVPDEESPLLAHETSATPVSNGVTPTDQEGEALSRSSTISSSRIEQFSGNAETRKRLKYIVPAVSVGIFLTAADQTIIVSSYGKIGSDFNALNLTSFIATAYFVTLTSFQPLYGKLSDIFGRKGCLLVSYAIFGLGGLGCGLSRDIYELIAARVFQGVGGGGMTTVVSVLLSDIVPLKDRGLWQGILNLIYATGAASGGPLGGIMSDLFSWRWAFLIQAPLCLVAFVAVYFVLEDPSSTLSSTASTQVDDTKANSWQQRVRRIDFLGALTLVLAVSSLIIGMDRGSNGSWSSPICYVLLILSVVFFGSFIFTEQYIATEPFAPGHLIFDRSLVAAYLCNLFSFGGWFGVMYYLPLVWQVVDGVSTTEASLRLLIWVIPSVTGSLFAGFYMRRYGKYRLLTILAYAALVVGVLGILLFTGVLVHSMPLLSVSMFISAFGNGNGVTTTLIALISNAAPQDQAVVTACSYLFRSLGSVIGISLSATVIQQVLRNNLRKQLGSGREANEIEQKVRQSLEYFKNLPPATKSLVRNAYGNALSHGFGLMLIICTGALVSSFFIKEKKLSK